MNKTDEYKVPDSVKNDDVAMWASEEDMLIYSHFYDKGRAEALNSQRKVLIQKVTEIIVNESKQSVYPDGAVYPPNIIGQIRKLIESTT